MKKILLTAIVIGSLVIAGGVTASNTHVTQMNKTTKSITLLAQRQVTGQAIVNYAAQFIGKPYVWGAKGPNSFDCSGLTYYVYNHFGYNIGQGTNSQRYAGTSVSLRNSSGQYTLSNLMPGDLIFFNYGAPFDHVGIYAGNGEYIAAENPQDGVMKINWRIDELVGARRILSSTDASASTTGWKCTDNNWRYYNSNGTMATGWITQNNLWYYLGTNGIMRCNWQEINGSWYYFNESGVMQSNWQQINNKWYYFNEHGVMLTGWQNVPKTGATNAPKAWFHFSNSGAME